MRPGSRHRTGLRAGAQFVTHSPDGMDQVLAVTIVYLAAQVVDVYIHYVSAGIERQVPHVLDDHGPGDAPSRVAHEIFQQAEFFGGQLDATARALHSSL